ncbi:DUF3289 family protein [Marinilongibacter aquaticus]|uniref:DUF3289 family protein n=1 Tax=Marinilongibacter aquaticus TaxID=2975157 RepID=UPI0021BD5ACA|nr:DUF3289 family protein [Marinilongibacter aquaticus]UBM57553.1 DUF3289 family protein [Marinilongibacter aquaticus]
MDKADDLLFDDMKFLKVGAYNFVLKENFDMMVQHFRDNQGTPYNNYHLDRAAEKTEDFKRFLADIERSMKYELKLDSKFFHNKGVLNYVNENNEKQIGHEILRPKVQGYNGLSIAVNDTWAYDVKIVGLKVSVPEKYFYAHLEITVWDHFGLDDLDIDPDEKPLYARFPGFDSWYILQHKIGKCYKPFITELRFKPMTGGKYD